MPTKNKLKPIKFYTTEEILRWNRKRKPLKPKRNKPRHWHLGECNPKLRIGIGGVTWQQWFECCKKMEKEKRECLK